MSTVSKAPAEMATSVPAKAEQDRKSLAVTTQPTDIPEKTHSPTARRSLAAGPESASKRLSTISNPAREAPPSPRPASSIPINSPTSVPFLTESPSSSPSASSASPPYSRTNVPSFPPPQASRISMVSTKSSNRGSFVAQFESSLSYTSVRDFAYPSLHPLHYGPTITSAVATPAESQRGSSYFESSGSGGWFTSGGSGYRRLSDPAGSSSDTSAGWLHSPAKKRPSNQPPRLDISSDGPPYAEDDDIHSPVVLEKAHRKHKSHAPHLQSHQRGASKNVYTPTMAQFSAHDLEGRGGYGNGLAPEHAYFDPDRAELADGEPGGEVYTTEGGEYYNDEFGDYSDEEGLEYDDENRFSRDYQFTIADPAEEMHGKAVALFDFMRENENELPLVEGQVVWVSYRHGMGWLVAEDPKTGESGLVPEEYVRLFRHMQADFEAAQESETPTSVDNPETTPTSPSAPAHISSFSTSSKDVNLYPLQNEHAPAVSTPTPANQKDRVEQIRREQERAIREEEMGEDNDTPRLGSDTFAAKETEGEKKVEAETEVEVRVNGKQAGEEAGGGDVAERKSEYYDAEEEIGKKREEEKTR